MELTNTSFVVLGMLNIGARSGYDIKRAVALSAKHFWKISPVQVYPELQRLESIGLVTGRDDPDSARKRRTYELTDSGREALREWITNGEETAFDLRDAGLLKLFFADAVEREDAIECVRQMRERSERLLAEFREQILPVAQTTRERAGLMFPAEAARLGAELHEWLGEWCLRFEQALEQPEEQ